MDNTTSKINERLLRELDAAEAITGAKIVKTDAGYVLVVQVSWKRGDLIVFNQRGKPRDWASLDRLLSYLAEMVPSVKSFELVLDQPLQLPGELATAAKEPVKPARKTAVKAPVTKPAAKPKAKAASKAGGRKLAQV